MSVDRDHYYHRDAERLLFDAESVVELVAELNRGDHSEEAHDEVVWRLHDVRKALDLLSIAEACDEDTLAVAKSRCRELGHKLWELRSS